MYKIPFPLAIFLDTSKLPRLLDGTITHWDFFLSSPDAFQTDSEPRYLRIAVLDHVPVEPSFETLVSQGLAGIRAQRTELHAQYQKALTELQGQESDLMLLSHTPRPWGEVESPIAADTPSPFSEFDDDIPY